MPKCFPALADKNPKKNIKSVASVPIFGPRKVLRSFKTNEAPGGQNVFRNTYILDQIFVYKTQKTQTFYWSYIGNR